MSETKANHEVVPVAESSIPPMVPHLSAEDSKRKGKVARAEVPRSSQAVFEPSPDRPDPVALLEEQAVTRVPELVPIRYGRMLVSPFTFYRGAALIMASDLSTTPRSGLNAQICGDAHLSNFGVFGSPERQLMFDCNDFDETNPGPWEWDVKRLAASFVVCGSRPRLLQGGGQGGRAGGGPVLPRVHGHAGRDDEPRGLVLAHRGASPWSTRGAQRRRRARRWRDAWPPTPSGSSKRR